MGATKKAYHHGDLRQALIDGACAYLRENSADALSLRALARQVGVSQTAPYRHFETKNALFAAIAVQGFELLTEALRATTEEYRNDTHQALIEIGVTYVDWALAHPEKYQMFFDSSLVDFKDYEGLQIAGSECFSVVHGLVKRGIDEGLLLPMPVSQLAATLWAGVHGISSLVRNKQHATEMDGDVPDALDFLIRDRRTNLAMLVNGITRPEKLGQP